MGDYSKEEKIIRKVLLEVLYSNENEERENWAFQDAKEKGQGVVENSDPDCGSEESVHEETNSLKEITLP